MDPYDLSIRLKTLDGAWEEVGAEAIRFRGVWPENVQYSHNDWGDDTCSFDLRRDPGAIHPDLSAFTDCEITVCGRLAWSGRVKETPTREGADPVINVQGEGWQYHMDDDQYERAYVHTRLSEWRDQRSFLTASLASFTSTWQVEVGDGGIRIAWPPATAAPGTGNWAAVTLDLGSSRAKRVVVTWDTNGDGNGLWWIQGNDTESFATAAEASSTTMGATPQTGVVTAFTFTTPRRYVTLLYSRTAAFGPGFEPWLRFTAVKVFADAAYESGNESILRADQILTDALDRATLLLDTDRSGIEAGVFDEIPEFATSQLVSPREVWNAGNAYENYETKIDARRPIFRPRASAPIYEIGEWSGAEFEDASANSGAEILNRVFVEGQTAASERLVVVRASGEAADAARERAPQTIPNPSFAVDATGWTTSGTGSVTRTTTAGQFDSAPAGGLLTWTTGFGRATATFTGTFEAGRTYVLSMRTRRYHDSAVYFGNTAETDFSRVVTPRPILWLGEPTFSTLLVTWTPKTTTSSVKMYVDAGSGFVYFDSIELYQSLATIIDRRGFLKSRTLPISNRITGASAARLGDLYLDQHRTTPFTGGFKAVGVGGVRRILGGQAVHPGWLGRDTGQLVRANHVIDPDTGGVGRDERMKTVSYVHNDLAATVSLAEDRGGLDALLAQLAVVVGS